MSDAVIKLMDELYKGEKSAQKNGWIDFDDVEKMLGIDNNLTEPFTGNDSRISQSH